MPKAERLQKKKAATLAKVAASPYQTKITNLMNKPSLGKETEEKQLVDNGIKSINTHNISNANRSEGQDNVNDEASPDNSHSRIEVLKMVKEIYREKSEDFSDNDKKNSDRNGRSCVKSWFDEFRWLFYNRSLKAVFCDICTKYDSTCSGGVYKHGVGKGFSTWNKSPGALREHQETSVHQAACSIRIERENAAFSTISAQLDCKYMEKQSLRQQGL